jgi:hypothetical protein
VSYSEQLKARYDDDRVLTIEGSQNHEVSLRLANQEPIFLDGLDLLRIVSSVVLDGLYGPSPTAGGPDA